MRLSEALWVVKISGKLCCESALRAAFATQCAAHQGPLVIVHGGGVSVSAWQSRLGYEAHFVQGRRVTPETQLPLVAMALAQVNQNLVQALVGCGTRAVGLMGADAGQVRCTQVAELGAVGTPERVAPALLTLLVQALFTPVLGPVCLDGGGRALNVNADELACDVAGALGAARLLMLSDVDAVAVDGMPQPSLAIGAIEALIAQGHASGGMVPKLRAAARAIKQGVGEVRIGGMAQRLEDVTGTRITGGI